MWVAGGFYNMFHVYYWFHVYCWFRIANRLCNYLDFLIKQSHNHLFGDYQLLIIISLDGLWIPLEPVEAFPWNPWMPIGWVVDALRSIKDGG